MEWFFIILIVDGLIAATSLSVCLSYTLIVSVIQLTKEIIAGKVTFTDEP